MLCRGCYAGVAAHDGFGPDAACRAGKTPILHTVVDPCRGFCFCRRFAGQCAARCGNACRNEPARWEKLLCLTGVMSPMFFTGTLAGWLGSAREGWVLLGIHWLGAVLTALIWPARWGENTSEVRYETPMRMSLPEAIAQSAHSLLCVCGAMMVFSVAACLVKSVLAALFPVWTAQHAGWLALLWGVMEIGGGSSAVIQAYEKPQALLSALCGFGGMSIWLQNLLFLGQNVRPAKLLFMRTVHGAVCYAIVSLIRPF